jgi:hypothetical protein
MHDGWITGSLVEEELFDRIQRKTDPTYTQIQHIVELRGGTARSPFTGLIRSRMGLAWPHRHTPMNIFILRMTIEHYYTPGQFILTSGAICLDVTLGLLYNIMSTLGITL